MFNEAIQALIENIKDMVSQMLKNADYDKAYTGRVKEIKQIRSGLHAFLYTVTINGKDYSIKSKLTYLVGDYVLVLVPRNNWSEARILATGNEITSVGNSNLESRVKRLEQQEVLDYRVLSVVDDNTKEAIIKNG